MKQLYVFTILFSRAASPNLAVSTSVIFSENVADAEGKALTMARKRNSVADGWGIVLIIHDIISRDNIEAAYIEQIRDEDLRRLLNGI